MAEIIRSNSPASNSGAGRKEHRPDAKVLRSMDGGHIPSDENVVVYACKGDGVRVRQPEERAIKFAKDNAEAVFRASGQASRKPRMCKI